MHTTARGSRLGLTALLAFAFVAEVFVAAAGQDARDGQYASALEQGNRALELRQFQDAMSAFKRASSLRDKRSAEAHFGMARVHRGMGAPKKAVESCTEALKYVGDDRELEADIRNIRGVSVVEWVGKKNDARLKDAEADFRAALALTARLPIAHYNLGIALLRQVRDAEGVEALKAFVAKAPDLQEAAEARRMIEHPVRARIDIAPDFAITTLQGERITLDDLRGRVVLIDFWATWCGPCVAATPGLQRLAKKYADQPFTLLAISLDRNERAWTAYIEKHRMDWPQYLDNGRLASLFSVRPIPTYIIIDHEGIIRDVETGYNSSTNGFLDGRIRKYLKDIPAVGGPPRGGW